MATQAPLGVLDQGAAGAFELMQIGALLLDVLFAQGVFAPGLVFTIPQRPPALRGQRQGAAIALHGRFVVDGGNDRALRNGVAEGWQDLHELAGVGCHGVKDRTAAPQHDAIPAHMGRHLTHDGPKGDRRGHEQQHEQRQPRLRRGHVKRPVQTLGGYEVIARRFHIIRGQSCALETWWNPAIAGVRIPV